MLIRRLTMVLNENRIVKVFIPVFPPDRNPQDVLEFMKGARCLAMRYVPKEIL